MSEIDKRWPQCKAALGGTGFVGGVFPPRHSTPTFQKEMIPATRNRHVLTP